ncbi:hypothetical protein JB92DRAFT_3007551 [Gautieria morchelliformis]|nr:hypothetical protein JB92DRAFT_3007551 [Gautieria morchelliformis]
MHLQQTSELSSVHSCPPSSCAYPISCLTFSTCVHSPSASIPFNMIAPTLPPQSSLFSVRGEVAVPTQQFDEVRRHARMLFGAGLGVDSLPIFTYVIRSTFPLRWTTSDNDPLLPTSRLSTLEEVAAGFIDSEDEIASAKASLDELYGALEESKRLVETWGGEFCFDRGYFAAEYWRSTL